MNKDERITELADAFRQTRTELKPYREQAAYSRWSRAGVSIADLV